MAGARHIDTSKTLKKRCKAEGVSYNAVLERRTAGQCTEQAIWELKKAKSIRKQKPKICNGKVCRKCEYFGGAPAGGGSDMRLYSPDRKAEAMPGRKVHGVLSGAEKEQDKSINSIMVR